jgi:hypothetical protein
VSYREGYKRADNIGKVGELVARQVRSRVDVRVHNEIIMMIPPSSHKQLHKQSFFLFVAAIREGEGLTLIRSNSVTFLSTSFSTSASISTQNRIVPGQEGTVKH